MGRCEALREWVTGQGRSESTASKVVDLLQAERLLSEPRPKAWNRRGQFAEEERRRYLWYRHAARLLGWKDRHEFPEFVRTLLKTHIFSSDGAHRETNDEAGREGSIYTVAGVHGGGRIGATTPSPVKGNAGHGGSSSVPRSDTWGLGFIRIVNSGILWDT